MLRPERMSKVSVTGAKAVMPEVIETVHELHLVHLSDYDGSWEGFDNGDPIEGADEASQKLVTVRALESTLDISEDDADPGYELDEAGYEERLESVRTRINDLDDSHDEVRERLRTVRDRIDSMEPFADLGIDVGLLGGYESVEVAVGEGSEAELRAALEAAEEVRAFDLFAGDDAVAVAAAPAEGYEPAEALSDALVGVEFSRYEVPDVSGSPGSVLAELREERDELESELDAIEAEMDAVKADEANFLLAVEEKLSVETQRAEAPLQFATTDRAFVAEGWIPTDEYDRFVEELRSAVGDRLEIEELERAAYDRHGHGHAEPAPEEGDGAEEPTPESDEQREEQAIADGGAVTVGDEPPVIQQNPKPVGPFEVLVKAVNLPKYREFDPTITLFLTFPLFFGFMIGDVGYGLLYVAIGYYVYSKFEGEALRSLGGVIVWSGAFTILFGILYGELFGLHMLGEWIWGGHPPIEKGLDVSEWALAWLVVAVVAGWAQLNVAYIMDFIEAYELHGAREAVLEAGSWVLMLNGLWIWVFSTSEAGSAGLPWDLTAAGAKPEFLFTVFNGEPFALGFAGFPELIGVIGLAAYLLGIVLLAIGPTHELAEFLVPMVHALSYTRLTAVLLSKAGMALVANMLFFGAYVDGEGQYHFLIDHGPQYAREHGDLMFAGLSHGGIPSLLAGLVVLVLAHLVVLAIGGTAALQAIRLEYVEFFGKFYEGGGEKYEPFGYDRSYTKED